MDTKHNDDILKTRGKTKKGENGQPPATPQPKKQEFKIKKIYRYNNKCKWLEILTDTSEEASKIEQALQNGSKIILYRSK